ncbi:MAG TPA: GAF domain-containing protein [Edaphocola sp.]|nr:GAF domain-containing protein [Edaphocola sp.]
MKRINALLSLVPFANFLKQKIAENNSIRTPFFEFALKRIQEIPGWDQEIRHEDIGKFKEIFELIYFTFSPPVTNESEDAWALAEPLSPVIIFSTSAFNNLIATKDGCIKADILKDDPNSNRAATRIKLLYSLILQRLFHLTTVTKNEIIHAIKDETTGLKRFYKLEFDTQFIDVIYEGGQPLDLSGFQAKHQNIEESRGKLQEFLPISKFRFEGFSIVHITDITTEYVIEHIKDVIVNLAPGQEIFQDIIDSLKNLIGDNNIEVKLFPILKVNGRLIMDSFEDIERHLNSQCYEYGFDKRKYLDILNGFTENPHLLFYPDIDVVQEGESEIVHFIRLLGVKSLVIIPVYFQKRLVGVLQMFSKEPNQLTAQTISLMNPVIPLLEQLLQTIIDDFELTIDNVIKNKFTSLQPSVQWRFNEVAWQYIRQKKTGDKAEIGHVYFNDVYPLYGAIDIRDSTAQRNEALQKDMSCRLDLIIGLLQKMKGKMDMELLDELIFKANKWQNHIEQVISSEDEYRMLLFFENEAEPVLNHFRKSANGLGPLIDGYFQAAGPDGVTFENRRQLEEALQTINNSIGSNLDKMNSKIQQLYPCYFQKFRSDGIEYDIYIGQSISPQQDFNQLYLKNLRLWQLSSMAEIARDTHNLLPKLSKKLETTQLIFIHTNTIDISFRNDERRFDVEGAYNIRYEMVKKRIDKVHIKGSNERLTQPGTIALVYFQQKDIEEYMTYINFMQEQGILEDHLQFLELEDLQGLYGLKALRLTVKR